MDIQQRSGSAIFSIVIEVQQICKALDIDKVKSGPTPIYPDSFIISLIIIKNLLGMNSESSFLRYLAKNHGDLFHRLPEQSWLNRKCRKLTPVCMRIQAQLVIDDDTLRVIDSTPIPVVKIYRAYNSPCFPKGKQTTYGYCAPKKEYYFGVKLSLIITPSGSITHFGVHAANVHDLSACKDMLKDMDLRGKTLLGDKGYYDGELRTILKNHGSHLVVPDKRRHQVFNTSEDRQLLKKRSLVETVIEQLKAHMKIHETLAQSYQGLIARLAAAILAFTFALRHNQQRNRPRLSVKSILI